VAQLRGLQILLRPPTFARCEFAAGAIGALVRESMRMQWCGAPALAVQQVRVRNAETMRINNLKRRSFLAFGLD
jgi:hypothetical protein